MKKLVYSALALTLTGVPALATDQAWTGLDKEIENLSASLSAADPSGPSIGGWIRSSYRHSSDIDANGGTPGTPDQSGFQLDHVRVEVEGDVTDNYGYRISFDLSTGNGDLHGASPNGAGTLRDAFARWRIAEGITGKLGRFKEPVARSALTSEPYIFFLDRTSIGDALNRRDLGLGINGSFEVLDWVVAFQDGADGQADEHKYTVRLSATLTGTKAKKLMEGAYGAGDETTVMAAVAWQDETLLDKGTVVLGELSLLTGPFYIAGEIADFDDGEFGVFGRSLFINDVSNTTPWDITATYALTPNWELGGRFEDNDDVDDTSSYTVGVNYYVHGHDLKWQAEWQSIMTDNAVGDIDQLGLGLTLTY